MFSDGRLIYNMAFHRDDFYTPVTAFMDPLAASPGYAGKYLVGNRGSQSHFPSISLHTGASLYKADQDNIPIVQLRRRTDYLFERGGFHSSAIGGLALAVSSSLHVGDYNENPNTFRRLDTAASSIPQVIRHPVIIEVGSFENLNELHLRDIHCTAGGSLEIINRNYTDLYAASSTIITSHADATFTVSSLDASNGWSEASCISTCAIVLSAGMDDARLSKVYSVATARGWTSSQKDRSSYVTVQRNGELTKKSTANSWQLPTYENTGATADLVHDIQVIDLTKDSMTANHSTTRTVSQLAANRPGVVLGEGEGTISEAHVTGFIAGNYLEKIKVQNCTGPIYIRNFIVDGERTRDIGIEIDNSAGITLENCAAIRCKKAGIQINNSDVASTRRLFAYRNYSTIRNENLDAAGIKLVNSTLNFSGVFTSSGSDMQHNNDVSIQDMIVNSSRNANGIIMHNSTITGGHARDENDSTQASGASFFQSHLNFMDGVRMSNSVLDLSGAIDLYGNDRGLNADNSQVVADEFFADHNQKEGVKLDKSKFVYNKNLTPITSYPSTSTQGSKSPFAGLKAQTNFYRNGQHLVLDHGSSFEPMTHQLVGNGGDVAASSTASSMGYIRMVHPMGVTTSGDVGSHLPAVEVLNGSNSRFIHLFAERTHSNASLGDEIAANAVFGDLLSVKGGSKALVQGSKNSATAILGPSGAGNAARGYHQQKHLAGVFAGENSVVEFNGPTVVARFGVGCLAENGSTMKFSPHRLHDGSLDLSGFELSGLHNHTAVEIQAFRGCIVANNNSNIIMEDLGDYASNASVEAGNYIYNTSALNTSAYTRAGSMQFYPNPNIKTKTNSVGNSNVLAGTNNPPTFTSGSLLTAGTSDNDGHTLPGNQQGDRVPFNFGIINPLGSVQVSGTSLGGMCVRALNNSNVKVKNVHFLTGYGNNAGDGHLGGCSGLYYDIDGGHDGSRYLNIWNLDNTSRMTATYCTVSGMDGSATHYHGPSSVYVSGSSKGDAAGGSPDDGTRLSPDSAYGAPSGTPDTGHLSVLDAFGMAPVDAFAYLSFDGAGNNMVYGNSLNSPFDRVLASSGTPQNNDGSALGVTFREAGGSDIRYKYGKSAFENYGPFRLFVSPDPTCKLLMSSPSSYIHPTSGANPDLDEAVYGLAYQMYAQGYNFSGIQQARTAVAGGVTVSSAYPTLLKPIPNYHDGKHDTGLPIATSGFYYCKEFVEDYPDQIILDEFAANIFANAKNFSLGQSGRPKRVTLIRSLNLDRMGGEVDPHTNTNRGDGLGTVGTFDLRSRE